VKRAGRPASESAPTHYACIVADPPWRYRHHSAGRVSAARQYPTMHTDEIAALFVPAAARAHLYLWTPSGHLLEGDASRVARAWGFVPMQLLTWVKPKIGMGYYFRSSTEHVLLFCVRGELPARRHDIPTHFSSSRALPHSQKPDALLVIAERMSPGPRLEMFARRRRDGWDVWGDQAPAAAQLIAFR